MPNRVTPYEKTTWADRPSTTSPINDVNLNHIENGIKNVTDALNDLNIDPQPATANTLGSIKVGERLSITQDGTLSADEQAGELPTATSNVKGGIKVGSTLSISNEVLNYNLPTASTSTKGGIKIESNNFSISSEKLTLKKATVNTLGGIMVGRNLNIDSDGVLNADDQNAVKATPNMTSDTTPSGIVTCSSAASSYDAYLAFNGDNKNSAGWKCNGSASGSWICYQFPQAVNITLVYLYNGGMSAPNGFKIQASNDGETWTDLYTGNIISNATGAKTVVYMSNNTNSYIYYRLYVTSGYSGSGIGLRQIEFYIISSGSSYVLPIASISTLGGVKLSSAYDIDSNDCLTITSYQPMIRGVASIVPSAYGSSGEILDDASLVVGTDPVSGDLLPSKCIETTSSAMYKVYNGTTTSVEWSSSDERIKENVMDLSSQLSEMLINNTIPKKFKYKNVDGYHYGMIAQETRALLDKLGEEDAQLEHSMGNTNIEDQRTINYSEYIPHLINYVKMLEHRIAVLERG